MTITIETMQHIAHLAKLQLSEAEIDRLADEMEKIVGFADKLSELDIQGVRPTTHAISVQNVLRNDELKPSYDREKMLQNAPERDAACFLVPKVVE